MNNQEEKIREEAEARINFKRHLKTYILINIIIWVSWYISRARFGYYDSYWPVYSTLGWGFGVATHYFSVYKSSDSAVEKEIKKIKEERGLH